MKPGGFVGVEAADMIGATDDDGEADEIDDVDDADDAEIAAPLERARIEHQRLAMVLANRPSDGPKQNGERNDGNGKADEEIVEALVVERAIDRLEEHEGIVDVSDLLAVILREDDFVFAVDGFEDERRDFAIVLGLAVFAFEV